MKRLRLAALLALPIGLGLYLNSVASWRPRTLAVYKSPVLSVSWSPDGKRLASAGGDGNVSVWDAEQMRIVRILESLPRKRENRVAFSPDGKSLAASYTDEDFMEGQLRLWDAATGTPRRMWKRDRSLTGVAFSRDGETLASSGYMSVTLWNTRNGKLTISFDLGDTFWIEGVALSPDSQTVIGLGEAESIHWWNARKATREVSFPASEDISGNCAAFSPDGKTLAIGTRGYGYVNLYDVQTREPRGSFATHSGPVTAVAFSSDGSTLAHGDEDGRVELLDVASRKSLRKLLRHTKAITSLAFAPDGNTLASGSADGTVRLWRLR